MITMTKQASIKESTPWMDGVNILNGKRNKMKFHPEGDNHGLSFYVKGEKIPASMDRAFRYKPPKSLFIVNCVAVRGEKRKAVKVEHKLSAAYGSGIDNLTIELPDGVCPRNGNAETDVVRALTELREEGSSDRHYLRLRDGLSEESRTVTRNGWMDSLVVKPSDDFVVDCTVGYPHNAISQKHYRFIFSEENYKNEIMRAKGVFFLPFGSRFLVDSPVRKIHGVRDENNLLIGGKDEPEFVNKNRPEGGYSGDGFVKHKILDIFGELALTGGYYKDTEFVFDKTGHAFNIYALRELFSRDCFEFCY